MQGIIHNRIDLEMHPSLLNKVVRGLQETSREPLLPESEIEIQGETSSIPDQHLLRWARQKLSMTPWFIEDNRGNLTTPLEPVLGVFALRTIFRGFFIGASFLPGSDLLLERRHLTLAIIGFYTAAYHLVSAFNALQGRIFITPVSGRPVVHLPADTPPTRLTLGGTVVHHGSAGYNSAPKGLKAICAKLSNDGKWVYEGRNLTHSTHWRELQQWVIETRIIPTWLDNFCRDCVYPTVRVDEATYLDAGFEQLKYMRHEAIYYGFGIDDWSFDQMANREGGTTNVSAKGKNYKQFAYGILQDILKETSEVFTYIQAQCSNEFEQLLPQICNITYSPPFDLRRDLIDQINDAIQGVPGSEIWISKLLAEAR